MEETPVSNRNPHAHDEIEKAGKLYTKKEKRLACPCFYIFIGRKTKYINWVFHDEGKTWENL